MNSGGGKKPVKVYVKVTAEFSAEGLMLPRVIVWEDGRKFAIDRVTDIRQAPAMRAGGQGDRYTVIVNGRQSYLFFERSASLTGSCIGRWFVERRAA